MGMQSDHNYYEVLEVSPQASQTEIQVAYQKAKATYSLSNPEIYNIFSKQEAQAWVEIIEEAFLVLGSPKNREAYSRRFDSPTRVVATDLPNFAMEEAEVVEEVEEVVIEEELDDISHLPPVKEEESRPLPSGTGSTSLSQYNINPGIEEAIEKQDLFDGLFLKKIRTYKNVDIQDFSKKTCIALRHLYAIENNNFSVLPAPVFVRGYIIQYCRILDLNEPKVVKSFMSLLANESQASL